MGVVDGLDEKYIKSNEPNTGKKPTDTCFNQSLC